MSPTLLTLLLLQGCRSPGAASEDPCPAGTYAEGDDCVYAADTHPRTGGDRVALHPMPNFRAFGLAAADFDGDGDTDLAVNSSENLVLLRNENGALGPPEVFPLTEVVASWILAFDVNGDGSPDLLFGDGDQTRLAVNDGQGGFAEDARLGGPLGLHDSKAADITGDGRQDLVTPAPFAVLTADGDGGLVPWFAGSDPLEWVDVGDVDGDGDIDVVGAANTEEGTTFLVARNDGSTLALTWSAREPVWPVYAVLADFDGDGDPDLVTEPGDDEALHGVNDGTGTFAFAGFGGTYCEVERRHARTGVTDLDGDGDLDFVVASKHGVCAFSNQGEGAFPDAGTNRVSTPRDVVIADLDGGGLPDLVFTDDYSGCVVVLYDAAL